MSPWGYATMKVCLFDVASIPEKSSWAAAVDPEPCRFNTRATGFADE